MRPSGLSKLWSSVLVLCLVLAACGGGGGYDSADTGPKPVQTEAARASSATVGAAGGRITATSTRGVRYTLVVPPGALETDTRISLTPITSMGDAPLAAGLRAAVRFAPSGLVFASEASLLIEGAAGPVASGKRTVGFSRSEDGRRMSLARPAAAAGVLALPVLHFSDAGTADATEEEIAEVPPPPTAAQSLFEQINSAGAVGLPAQPTPADVATFLRGLFVTFVKPALDVAGLGSSMAQKRAAFDVYKAWVRIGELSTDADSLVAALSALTTELGLARPVVAAAARALMEIDASNCAAGAGELSLFRFLNNRNLFRYMGINTSEFGLDDAATLARVRECARPVIDPIALPSPIRPGTAFSLDTRAGIVFAAAPQSVTRGEFQFRITATDANLPPSATGLSDSEARFTTVATPTAEKPVFTVQACYLIQSGAVSNLVPTTVTDLCETVKVPEQCGRIVSQDVDLATAADLTAFASVSEVQGTVSISMRDTAVTAIELPCLQKVKTDLRFGRAFAAVTSLKLPGLREVGGSVNISADRIDQLELPALAQVGGFLEVTQLHRTMTSVRVGPAFVRDSLVLDVRQSDPILSLAGLSGIDGMSVLGLIIYGDNRNTLCKSVVQALIDRLEIREPTRIPDFRLLRDC